MRPRLRTRASPGGGSLRRYLGDDEQTLLVARQHPFALVRAAFDVFVLIAPLLVAAWGIAGTELLRGAVGTWMLRAIFLFMLLLVGRLAWRVLAWEFERVVITDEKVIHLAGVLDRRIASTPLAKVSEFTVRQPLLGRFFDYGSLVVDVPGGRDQALHGLAFLPDPAGLYRLVSDQARRGRVHEGGGRMRRDDAPGATTLVLPPADEGSYAGQVDPWAPSLRGDLADHTIQIPRVPPRGS